MLARRGLSPLEERSARKSPLGDREAKTLLGKAKNVVIARGAKAVEKSGDSATIGDLKGPTGKVRAPMLLIGGTLLVGFHASTLERLTTGAKSG